MRIEIKRNVYTDKQVTGKLTVFDKAGKAVFTCHTLELADNNNSPRNSCIPPGKYQVKKRASEKYGNHFHIQDVPNRSFILIHHGNFYTDILGCILPGSGLVDINGDGYKDVTNSRATMLRLMVLMPGAFELTILK